jgi:23S rRNA pseudouridine2605 synthase
VRIQKVLAEAGLASRRACEQLVLDGRVTVNGQVVTNLPWFVDPSADKILMDGAPVRRASAKKVYVLLNKPKGTVCTNADPKDRQRAVDLVAEVHQRVFPVGRLDAESTGLILLTNDGEFANRVAHPRYEVPKTYHVEVEGFLPGPDIEALKAGGLVLDGRPVAGVAVRVIQRNLRHTVFEVRLRESGNREIRRLMARLGYKVRSLRRVAIGPVGDRGLKTGHWRMLKPDEIRALTKAAKPEDAPEAE